MDSLSDRRRVVEVTALRLRLSVTKNLFLILGFDSHFMPPQVGASALSTTQQAIRDWMFRCRLRGGARFRRLQANASLC